MLRVLVYVREPLYPETKVFIIADQPHVYYINLDCFAGTGELRIIR